VPTTVPNPVAMALRSLLDTNICIYLMKHQPPQVVERFGRCRVGEVVVSAITAVELEFGVAASGSDQQRNCEALDRFLAEVPVAPFDRAAALAYGPVRLQTRERRRVALDKSIAANALALGAILNTNNPRDFQLYPGLVIENWLE
jgi:tRNA(fMet)-specific endonuclease VapC